MGWDYTHATHYTRTGAIDKKAEIDELYTWQNDTKKYEVVRSCMVGATYYAAVKATVSRLRNRKRNVFLINIEKASAVPAVQHH